MKRARIIALLIALCPAMALAVTNTGSNLPAVFEGHVLSGPTDADAILYAPTEIDSPTFRADLAALTGATVDYFDARYGTPDATLLADYDAVMTWVNYAYADSELMGDNLADFVDAGGKVILGQWCIYTDTAIPLQGRIMEPEYCPVTGYYWTPGSYNGDGTDCATEDVISLESSYNDVVSLVGGGGSDGTMSHGGLATAWRDDMAVWYSPANTGAYYSTGDWAQLTANMVECGAGFLFPKVDIKCNGSAGPLTIIFPDHVVIDVDLNPRDALGIPGDLFVGIKRGSIYNMYDGTGWTYPVPFPFTGYAMFTGPLAPISATVLYHPLPPGSYTGLILVDPVADNSMTYMPQDPRDSVDFTVLPEGTQLVLIWNPSGQSSGAAQKAALAALGVAYETETGALPADISFYAAIFADLGVYPGHVLTSGEGTQLAQYLASGGNLYMEGSDTWYYDTPTSVHGMFGLTGISDGSADLYNLTGLGIIAGTSFEYAGPGNYIDNLQATAGVDMFQNTDVGYICGVSYAEGTYNTVGCSFNYGDIIDGTYTKLEVMQAILTHFGL